MTPATIQRLRDHALIVEHQGGRGFEALLSRGILDLSEALDAERAMSRRLIAELISMLMHERDRLEAAGDLDGCAMVLERIDMLVPDRGVPRGHDDGP
jgi:hypothetical protein